MEQLTKEDRPTMRAEYLKRDTADPAMNQWIQKADGTAVMETYSSGGGTTNTAFPKSGGSQRQRRRISSTGSATVETMVNRRKVL